MGIDKPSGSSDSSPDRPREPEYPVPRRENPAARERSSSLQDSGAPVTRQERAADAEAHRLARIARRAEKAAAQEAPEASSGTRPESKPEARTATRAEPRPGDKGVITHFSGPTVDLYTDGTRWASGDVIRGREAERQRREGTGSEGTKPSTGVPSMSQYGRDTIGVRPDDAADLPPERKDLVEEGVSKKSRGDRFRRSLEDEDILGDAHDVVHDGSNVVVRALDARQPQGHPMQIQRDTPQAGALQHGQPSAGDIAVLGLFVGMMVDRGLQALHNMRTHKREVD